MRGVRDRRHDRPEGDVGEAVRFLRGVGRDEAAADVGAVGVDVVVEGIVEGLVLEDDVGDLAGEMAHVEAPERAVGAAEARRVALLLEQQEARAGVAAGGEDDAGGGDLPPALFRRRRARARRCRRPAGSGSR